MSATGTTITVNSTNGFPPSGSLVSSASTSFSVGQTLTYTGTTSTTFTGVTGSLTPLANGDPIYLLPDFGVNPNITFLNVYTGNSEAIQAVTPGDVVLAEYSYISQSSRNDLNHNVNNAVDVYVDGQNDTQASTIFLPNFVTNLFSLNSNSPWYYENYRRDGNPTKRPQLNNWITPLFWSPVDGLPPTITIGTEIYYLGTHYWLVHEIGPLGGSIRARDGIEWNNQLCGDPGGSAPPYPGGVNGSPTPINNPPGGKTVYSATINGTPIEVDNYLYDTNITTLQASFDANRQITTDALAHRATERYFKLDITVVYDGATNGTVVNSAISTALQQYYQNQYFGTVIELSTLLEIIHNVSGVNNVRWSNDLPNPPNSLRVIETDINGVPLHGASIDRLTIGVTNTTSEQQTLYIVGNPRGIVNGVEDSFTLQWIDGSINIRTNPINFVHSNGVPVTASDIASAINAAVPGSGSYAGTYTVTEDFRPTTHVVNPIRSFTITYPTTPTWIQPVLPIVTNSITQSDNAFNEDFFLLDHELPALPAGQITGDTLPGLIIRVRTQNTLFRPGLG